MSLQIVGHAVGEIYKKIFKVSDEVFERKAELDEQVQRELGKQIVEQEKLIKPVSQQEGIGQIREPIVQDYGQEARYIELKASGLLKDYCVKELKFSSPKFFINDFRIIKSNSSFAGFGKRRIVEAELEFDVSFLNDDFSRSWINPRVRYEDGKYSMMPTFGHEDSQHILSPYGVRLGKLSIPYSDWKERKKAELDPANVHKDATVSSPEDVKDPALEAQGKQQEYQHKDTRDESDPANEDHELRLPSGRRVDLANVKARLTEEEIEYLDFDEIANFTLDDVLLLAEEEDVSLDEVVKARQALLLLAKKDKDKKSKKKYGLAWYIKKKAELDPASEHPDSQIHADRDKSDPAISGKKAKTDVMPYGPNIDPANKDIADSKISQARDKTDPALNELENPNKMGESRDKTDPSIDYGRQDAKKNKNIRDQVDPARPDVKSDKALQVSDKPALDTSLVDERKRALESYKRKAQVRPIPTKPTNPPPPGKKWIYDDEKGNWILVSIDVVRRAKNLMSIGFSDDEIHQYLKKKLTADKKELEEAINVYKKTLKEAGHKDVAAQLDDILKHVQTILLVDQETEEISKQANQLIEEVQDNVEKVYGISLSGMKERINHLVKVVDGVKKANDKSFAIIARHLKQASKKKLEYSAQPQYLQVLKQLGQDNPSLQESIKKLAAYSRKIIHQNIETLSVSVKIGTCSGCETECYTEILGHPIEKCFKCKTKTEECKNIRDVNVELSKIAKQIPVTEVEEKQLGEPKVPEELEKEFGKTSSKDVFAESVNSHLDDLSKYKDLLSTLAVQLRKVANSMAAFEERKVESLRSPMPMKDDELEEHLEKSGFIEDEIENFKENANRAVCPKCNRVFFKEDSELCPECETLSDELVEHGRIPTPREEEAEGELPEEHTELARRKIWKDRFSKLGFDDEEVKEAIERKAYNAIYDPIVFERAMYLKESGWDEKESYAYLATNFSPMLVQVALRDLYHPNELTMKEMILSDTGTREAPDATSIVKTQTDKFKSEPVARTFDKAKFPHKAKERMAPKRDKEEYK